MRSSKTIPKSAIWSIIALFFCALLLARCGGDDDPEPATPAPEISWKAHVIDSTCHMPISIDTYDVNKDSGWVAIVVPLFQDDQLVFYYYIDGVWQKDIIDEITDGPTFAYCGKTDMGYYETTIFSNSYPLKQISFYDRGFSSWHKNVIIEPTDNADFFQLADLNNDGRLDILTAGFGLSPDAGNVIWYENDHPNWTPHIVIDNYGDYPIALAEDFDGDGLLDIAATDIDKGELVIFRNNSSALNWTKIVVDDDLKNAFGLYIDDIDKNGKPDIIATNGGFIADGKSVYLYKNNYPNFSPEKIDDNLSGAGGLSIADVNNDGLMDILATGYSANEVLWYKAPNWERMMIDGTLEKPRGILVLDVNNDELMDVIVTSDFRVMWYEQILE
jgi:hypothetical protein